MQALGIQSYCQRKNWVKHDLISIVLGLHYSDVVIVSVGRVCCSVCWWLRAKDMQPTFPRTFNIPLELTPNSQPTAYEGIPFIWGVADALQDFDQDSPSWTFSERCLMWPRQSTKDIKASYSVLQNAWFLKQTQLYQDSFWSDEVIDIPPVNHGPLGKFDHSTRHLTSVSAFSSLLGISAWSAQESPTWDAQRPLDHLHPRTGS